MVEDFLQILVFAGIVAGLAAALMMILLWIAMLGDVFATPSDVWVLAGQSRAFCFSIVFALGPVGAILYGLAVRPSLARIEMAEPFRKAKGPGQWSASTAA